MSILLYNIFYYTGYVAVPIISLIVFGKIKKPLWLTLPIAFIADIIVSWNILTSYEFGGLAVIMIFYQLVSLCILIAVITVIAKVRRKKLDKLSDGQKASYLSKEKKAVIFVCIAAGLFVSGVVSHSILLSTSDGYNQIFDRKAFSELIKIDVNDITEVELIYSRMKLEEEPFDVNYYGDKSFIHGLVFDGSRFSNPGVLYGDESCSARFITKNHENILFMTGGGDRFLVHYKNRQFYIRSPQLWEEIKK